MRQLLPKNNQAQNLTDLHEGIGKKINNHLANLGQDKASKHKREELCQIGKLIYEYFSDFEILQVSESPDFIISDGILTIGVEHQRIVDQDLKPKEGFYESVFDRVEHNLIQDESLPNFLLNVLLKRAASVNVDRQVVIAQMTAVLTDFIRTGNLIENDIIERVRRMPHSRKSINANSGAFLVRYINEDLIKDAIKRKEDKLNLYIANSVRTQWLVLVIGRISESSYELDELFDVQIESKFDKILLYEDFSERLFEIR